MSPLSPRADQDAAIQRARLVDFTDGFKRECGDDITVEHVELRQPAQSDELIIFIHFLWNDKRCIAAVDYHLPDCFATYDELGAQYAMQWQAERQDNELREIGGLSDDDEI